MPPVSGFNVSLLSLLQVSPFHSHPILRVPVGISASVTLTKQSFKQSSHRSRARLPSPPGPILPTEMRRLDSEVKSPLGTRSWGFAGCPHSSLEMTRPSAIPSVYISVSAAHSLHTQALRSSCSSSPSLLSLHCASKTHPPNPPIPPLPLCSNRPQLQNLHWLPPPPKGGPLEARKTKMPLPLTPLM